MTRSRVAVVGVGHLGQHHARILAEIPEVELVAVADSRIEQAQAIASKLGCRAVGDYRKLFNDVDAVSIAVPTTLHREVAGAFLDRRIATLVEKPLAANCLEAEELVALAEARRTLLQVGHIERFNPALSALEGLPMRPKYISAERLSTYTFRSTDIGVVLDLMIHDIDLILSMNPGPIRSVSAVGVSVFGDHEDIADARIEFEGGCVANLTASRASFQAMRKMRLWASEGYAMLDFMTRQGTLVQPSEALRRGDLELGDVDMTNPTRVKEHLFGTVLRVDQVQAEPQDQLRLELDDFVSALRNGSTPRVSGQQGLRAMRLATEVIRSINDHQWEGVGTGPIGPNDLPQPLPSHEPLLKGPFSWRHRTPRSVGATRSTSS